MSGYKRRIYNAGNGKLREVERSVQLFIERGAYGLAAMRQQELIYALKSNGLEYKGEVEELVTFLIHASRPDEALEALDQLFELDPSVTHLLPLRGILLHSTKRTKEAKQLQTSVKNRADVPEDAKALLDKALQLPSALNVAQIVVLGAKDPHAELPRPKPAPSTPNPTPKPTAAQVVASATKSLQEPKQVSKSQSPSKNNGNRKGLSASSAVTQKENSHPNSTSARAFRMASSKKSAAAAVVAAKAPVRPAAPVVAPVARSVVGGLKLRAWSSMDMDTNQVDRAPPSSSSTCATALHVSPDGDTEPATVVATTKTEGPSESKPISPRAQHLPDLATIKLAMSHWKQQATETAEKLKATQAEIERIREEIEKLRMESELILLTTKTRHEKLLLEEKQKINRMKMGFNILMSSVNEHADGLIPDEFFCPVSLELMTDPVMTTSGQSYERSAIERVLKNRHEDPLTRKACTIADLRTNYALATAIASWKRQRDSLRVVREAGEKYFSVANLNSL